MFRAAPARNRTRATILTAGALAVAGVTTFTAHAVFADTPAPSHAPATVAPGVTTPGYDARIDGLNAVEREAALKLQRLRAARAAEFNTCHQPAPAPRAC
jgi:hypothetical protein